MLRVIELEAVDIKGARRITLHLPEDEAVHKIGGPNGGGKTSGGPDAFWLVMAKASEHPPDALRHGSSKGHAKIVFSNGMTATRKLRRNKSPELVVTGPDGTRMGAPQSVLDELYKNLGWDLADIMRLSDKELAKQVKELAGIDWTKLEAEYARVYEERTAINRDIRQLDAELEALPPHDPEAPAEVVSTADLVAELEQAQAHNRRGNELRQAWKNAGKSVADSEFQIEDYERQLARLQAQLEQERQRLAERLQAMQQAQLAAENHTPADEEAIRQRLASSHTINVAVAANAARRAKEEALKTHRLEQQQATDRLKWIEEEKRRQLAEAQLPVEGLSFADDGLRYQGVLLSNLNEARRIQVSAAIGIALNPKLPMVICRHGAHLTRESLAALEEEVARLGGQALVEHPWLGDDECTAVIRDGVVVGGRQLKLGGK